jgi:hypothetical protein
VTLSLGFSRTFLIVAELAGIVLPIFCMHNVVLLINYRICLQKSLSLAPKLPSLIPLAPSIHLLLCSHLPFTSAITYLIAIVTLTFKKFLQHVLILFAPELYLFSFLFLLHSLFNFLSFSH